MFMKRRVSEPDAVGPSPASIAKRRQSSIRRSFSMTHLLDSISENLPVTISTKPPAHLSGAFLPTTPPITTTTSLDEATMTAAQSQPPDNEVIHKEGLKSSNIFKIYLKGSYISGNINNQVPLQSTISFSVVKERTPVSIVINDGGCGYQKMSLIESIGKYEIAVEPHLGINCLILRNVSDIKPRGGTTIVSVLTRARTMYENPVYDVSFVRPEDISEVHLSKRFIWERKM